MEQRGPSSRWGQTTKLLMALVLISLIAFVLYGIRTVLAPLVLASLFAYIVAPVVSWLKRRLRVPRGLGALLIYLIGLGLVAIAPAVLIPTVVDNVSDLVNSLDSIINNALAWLDQTQQITVFGRSIPLPALELPSINLDRIITLIQQGISPVAGGFFSVLRALGSAVASFLFMAVVAFYLMVDAERIAPALVRLAPPSHREEAGKLLQRVNATWNAFVRGQLLLSLTVGAITGVTMAALGVRFAVALGIVAGVMEILPGIGPILAAIPAVLLALFEGAASLPLTHFWAAVVVAGAYVLIQQLENNLLVPRILGASLELHPLVVIVGVLAGATLWGILGALLAAPTISTLRVVVGYIYRKLLDMEPFPEPPPFPERVSDRDVRAILFDLDGTLLDTDELVIEYVAERLRQVPLLRHLYNSQRLARRIMAGSEQPLAFIQRWLDLFGADGHTLSWGKWLEMMNDQLDASRYLPVDGVIDLIRRISRHYDLAIVTSRNRADVDQFMEDFRLDKCFAAVVAWDDVRRHKPSPDPIRCAARRLGRTPEQCILVGDTPLDVRAGQRAGALTVGVLCGFGERPQMERQEPDLILDTTADLIEYLPDGFEPDDGQTEPSPCDVTSTSTPTPV
ncbi:MAG: AI-2E family transporter [Anaerolineae bacterium]